MTPTERDWLRVRSYLTEHRHDLAVRAAAAHPAAARVAGPRREPVQAAGPPCSGWPGGTGRC
jgi:hypothetical protein